MICYVKVWCGFVEDWFFGVCNIMVRCMLKFDGYVKVGWFVL